MLAEQREGRTLVISTFDAIGGRGAELARFDLDREINPLQDNVIGAVSPDGSQLAITRSPESPIEIHSLTGQLIKKISAPPLGRVIYVVWAADQKGFFVTRKVEGGTEILHVDTQGHLDSVHKCLGQVCGAVPSSDGHHLAYIDRKQTMNMWMMENF